MTKAPYYCRFINHPISGSSGFCFGLCWFRLSPPASMNLRLLDSPRPLSDLSAYCGAMETGCSLLQRPREYLLLLCNPYMFHSGVTASPATTEPAVALIVSRVVL